ncbi:MAG: hypothetical protein K9M08_12610 [Pirellula sp.]|nr:hypothetical protein [Pirellula sp.]
MSQARLVDSSVPAQLGRLREIGLVEETPLFPSKKMGYQIAERFFNIWYLMRFASRRQRASLACLTRFLEEFHTPAERTRSAHPSDDVSQHNLAFLLRDHRHEHAEAKSILRKLRQPEVGRDTQALHDALFAAYEDDWPQISKSMKEALALIEGRLPSNTRDDWFRASAVLLHLGFGERLVGLLKECGADVTFMPWFAAVQAHTLGDKRHLVNIPLEARPAAEQIFDQIDQRRQQLPPPSK